MPFSSKKTRVFFPPVHLYHHGSAGSCLIYQVIIVCSNAPPCVPSQPLRLAAHPCDAPHRSLCPSWISGAESPFRFIFGLCTTLEPAISPGSPGSFHAECPVASKLGVRSASGCRRSRPSSYQRRKSACPSPHGVLTQWASLLLHPHPFVESVRCLPVAPGCNFPPATGRT